MRAAIVHYWLLNRRGGEKVLDALCRLLPDADIFTLFCDPAALSPELRRHRITASFLNPARRWYRSLLPLMPMALESFDLRGYDLVISSESGPAKGVMTSSSARHICYCHTPMRYLWDLYPAYRREWTRHMVEARRHGAAEQLSAPLGFRSAPRAWIGSSPTAKTCAPRIWRTYRREADVVYPPVDVESFCVETGGRLLPDRVRAGALQARRHWPFDGSRAPGGAWRIAGGGPGVPPLAENGGARAWSSWAASATPNCATCMRAAARCCCPAKRISASTPVEALASGKPVIALGRGGALETVPEFGGVFYRVAVGREPGVRACSVLKNWSPWCAPRNCRRGRAGSRRRNLRARWRPRWGVANRESGFTPSGPLIAA